MSALSRSGDVSVARVVYMVALPGVIRPDGLLLYALSDAGISVAVSGSEPHAQPCWFHGSLGRPDSNQHPDANSDLHAGSVARSVGRADPVDQPGAS